jgi:hypothetical protein
MISGGGSAVMTRVLLCLLATACAATPTAGAPPVTCDVEELMANAQSFFDACEQGRGSNATKPYVSSSSTFNAQCTDALPGPPLSQVGTILEYSDWMAVVHKEFPTAKPIVGARAVDALRLTAVFFGTFLGSDYIYVMGFEPNECKLNRMTKVWNDGWAAKHPPP